MNPRISEAIPADDYKLKLVFTYVIELVLKLRHALGLAEVVVSSTPSEEF